MKLFRFMSKEEFNKLLSGKTLVNKTDFSKICRTGSKGFCFFAEDDVDPEYAKIVIPGTHYVCVMFDVAIDCFSKSAGLYAKPQEEMTDEDFEYEYETGFSPLVQLHEYCIDRYNIWDCVPVAISYFEDCSYDAKNKWYKFNH